jgi:tetratricopeptide (TPR) repeat protein
VVGLLVLFGLGLAVLEFFIWPAATHQRAQELLRRHDAAAASALLEPYLARWPDDPEALLLAAHAARRADACPDAERFLIAFERAATPTEASRLEWALLGVQQGDFGNDESAMRSAVAGHHRAAPAMLEALAKGYAVAFRWPPALEAVNQLLELDPDHVPALVLRASLLGRLRQPERALEAARKAVTLLPHSAAAQTALAGLLNDLGYSREAIDHYRQAQQAGAAAAATQLGLARAFTDAAALAEAQDCLDELLSAAPAQVEGLVERGRLALRQGRPAEAEPFLERVSRAAPWHRSGQQLYLLALRELGRQEAALECEARLAELQAEDARGGQLKLRARNTPGDAEVRWDLWLWCQRNGEADDGLAWLTGLLQLQPRHGPAHAALADHFARCNQPRRAARHRALAGPASGALRGH